MKNKWYKGGKYLPSSFEENARYFLKNTLFWNRCEKQVTYLFFLRRETYNMRNNMYWYVHIICVYSQQSE